MQKINETKFIFPSLLCFVAAFSILKLSGFSSSLVVNFQSYIMKTAIVSTAGMDTLGAVSYFIQPIVPVVIGLICFVAGLAILVCYGARFENHMPGIFVGFFSALVSVVIFPTLLGGFLAAATFVTCFFAIKLAHTYMSELKKWVDFRVGSHAVGRCMFLFSLIMTAGIFVVVLSNQAAYSESFRIDISQSMKSIARSMPGASLIPEQMLDQQIDQAVLSSEIFRSYERWIPVTSALSVWFILETLGILLSFMGGLMTYAILKVVK